MENNRIKNHKFMSNSNNNIELNFNDDINNTSIENNGNSKYDDIDVIISDINEFSQSWNELEKADEAFDKEQEKNIIDRNKVIYGKNGSELNIGLGYKETMNDFNENLNNIKTHNSIIEDDISVRNCYGVVENGNKSSINNDEFIQSWKELEKADKSFNEEFEKNLKEREFLKRQ